MKNIIFPCFRLFLVLVVLTGIIYPLVVTGLAQLLFHDQSQGSLVTSNHVVVGSRLLSQKTEGSKYFWPRPSAADYATVASGASNLGPASVALKKAIADQVTKLGHAPDDLLTASASGLDPEISPEGAAWQIERVAEARNFSSEQTTRLKELVQQQTEAPQLGFLGEPRVNVLMLNLALDQLK
jgi:potassium-transporting ATPase KdpC subunit